MDAIELKLDAQQKGAFFINDGNERVAEMVIAIKETDLVVYHTEVSDKLKGKGVAAMLLAEMVTYARKQHLKVVPLCAYVSAQFKRHPDQYADIWNQKWHH
jgi:uncharacterized protein